MPPESAAILDQRYLAILVKRIRVSKRYKPKFGQGQKTGIAGSPIQSTYTFSREVIGYDLAAFFNRNTGSLRIAVTEVLKTLLKAND